MLFADEIPRVSIAQLRANYKPRRFRELNSIEVVVAGHVTELQLVTTAGDGCVGMRKWLLCHGCGRNVNVLGYATGFAWSCKRCLGWRSRARPTVERPAAETANVDLPHRPPNP